VARRSAIAKSELEVARIVWNLGEAGVRQVLEALAGDRALDFKTVQTYLRRLEAKGYLAAKMVGRVRVYRPRVRPSTVVREVIDDLIGRLFGGESLPLFRHLIEDRGLSAAEVAELRAMLDRLEAEAT
jgi:predicted transcriptional regulator